MATKSRSLSSTSPAGQPGGFELAEEPFAARDRPVRVQADEQPGAAGSGDVRGLSVQQQVRQRRSHHGAAVIGQDREVIGLQPGAVNADQVLGDRPPARFDLQGQEMISAAWSVPSARWRSSLCVLLVPGQERLGILGLPIGDLGSGLGEYGGVGLLNIADDTPVHPAGPGVADRAMTCVVVVPLTIAWAST
ncbi:hypothetical protein [Streptomyces luteogriseus]|uniref:hypothetical protein n=1 Tax=Streptomyces luteogriseus TaxID=68233 RepID=UPI00378EEFD2